MRKPTKIMSVALIVVLLSLVAIVSSFAAAITPSDMPTSGAIATGTLNETSGKFVISYSLFDVDENNKTLYVYSSTHNNYPAANLGNFGASTGKIAIDDEEKVTKIVIGDGIQTLQGTVSYFSGLKTFETSISTATLPANFFKDCANLRSVYIREIGGSEVDGVCDLSRFTSINATAFDGCSADLKIKGYSGCAAETFATQSGRTFVERPKNGYMANGYTWSFENGVLTIDGTYTGSGTKTVSHQLTTSYDKKTNIAWNPFYTSITEVNIKEETKAESIAAYAFGYLHNNKKVTIPSTVTNLSPSNSFTQCIALEKFLVHGTAYPEDIPQYFIDLRNVTSIYESVFADGKTGADYYVYLKSDASSIPKTSFRKAATVTFCTKYVGYVSNAEKLIDSAIAAEDTAIAGGNQYAVYKKDYYYPNPLVLSGTNTVPDGAAYTWSLDKESGTLTIASTSTAWNEFKFSNKSELYSWLVTDGYGPLVKKLVIDSPEGYELDKYSTAITGTFYHTYMPNLEHFCTEIKRFVTSGKSDIFVNNPNLKSFGLLDSYVEGEINFNDIVFDYITTNENYIKNFFKDNTGITKADLTGARYYSDRNMKIQVVPVVSEGLFSGCTSLEQVTIPADITEIRTNAFAGCTALKKVYLNCSADLVTLTTFPDNVGLEIYCATEEECAKINALGYTNVVSKLAPAEILYSGNCKVDGSGYTWDITDDGVLTISGTSTSTTLGFTTVANWDTLTNIPWYNYCSSIKKVVIEEETGITAIQNYALSYLPYCTTIILPKTCVDLSGYNIFASCNNLSSIAYCGEDVIDGVIDISRATKINGQLFESSSAGKTLTVIIGKPQSLSVVLWFKPTTTVNFKTYEDSLAVDIYNKFGTASDPRDAGFKFIVGNLSYIYDIKGAIKMEGFKIRYELYNGLRGMFSFNESESAKYTNNGYTLLEYGTIIASSASRASYGTALTFNKSANAFETANPKVVKAAVYQDASLSKNGVSGYVGKTLGRSSDEESGDQLVNYAVAVVNYEDNYMSDVYMAAYSIYRDDASCQLYITYADYSENNSDYAETSIYDLTLGMYKTGFCNAENDPDGVIWGVLEACAVTLTEGTHYRAGDYDLNGEPFGETYTYKNVPVYKSSYDSTTVLITDNNYNVYPITFIEQNLTLTLLPDGDSYVMVYRSTAGDGKTVGLPAHSEYGYPPAFAQYREEFNSYKRETTKPGIAPLLYDISGPTPVAVGYIDSARTKVYNVDGFSGTGYRCQPTPTFIKSAVTEKVTTVILDHGISAINNNSLSYLTNMKTCIYPKTLTKLDKEGFLRANSITTIAEKGGIYKEGFLDLGGIETLSGTRQFVLDTNTTAKATELRLPNVTKLPATFIMRMTNLTTVWMGDISNRVEGFANLTGIKAIDSEMFMGCTSLTKYYLDDNVTLSSTNVGEVTGTQIFTQNKNDSVAANTYVTSGNAMYRYGYTLNQALNYPDLSAIADIRSFDTNINSSLLLITNVEDEADLKALLGENAPQVAIMDVDISDYESSGEIFDLNIVGSNGEVITTALDTIERYTKSKIIPAFRAESTEEAEAVARFMTSTAMNDLMLIAPDMSMIEAARAINNKVNGVLDCTGAGYTFDAAGLRAIKDTVKTAGLNICILPSSAATQDNVEYLTDRFVQTWFDDDDSASETVELFKLINAGAFGVVTQNTAKFIEIVESDIFALNSRTRVSTINNHNCYSRTNALGNEIATARTAVEDSGVQCVELDVNMTNDKVLIVNHNRSETVNGTTYNYANMTYEEIKAIPDLQGIGQISLYFDYMLANRDIYDMIFRVEIKSENHTTIEQAEALGVLVSVISNYKAEEQAYILDHLQMVSFSSTVCKNARSSLPTVQQSYLYMTNKTVSEVLDEMLTSGYHQILYYEAGHTDSLSLSKEDYMALLIRGNLYSAYGSKASAPSTATLFLDNEAYISLDGGSAAKTAANLPARLTSGASSYNVSVGETVEAEIKQFSCADLVKYGSEGTAVTSATMHVIDGDASGVTFDGTNIKGLSAGTYTVVFRYSFKAYNNTAHIYTMPVTITVG